MCVKDQLEDYLPQILQIQSGLKECGLTKYLKNEPEIWRPLFESGNMFMVSAGEILDQINVDFSMSQLAKDKEIDTFKFFSDVLECIDAGGKCPDFPIIHLQKHFIKISFAIYIAKLILMKCF